MEKKAHEIWSICYEIIHSTDDEKVIQNAIRCIHVLEHGAQKHGSRSHRGALADIEHARAHILTARSQGKPGLVDPESGHPHLINAAVDCLLAFGALVGLVKPTDGETLG